MEQHNLTLKPDTMQITTDHEPIMSSEKSEDAIRIPRAILYHNSPQLFHDTEHHV